MKTRRIINHILILSLLVFCLGNTASSQAAVTDPGTTGALWTAAFSDPYFMGTSMTSTPIVTKDDVYVVNRDTLYALSRKTGKTLFQIELPVRMNSVCDPFLEGDRLYIPLSHGVITCVDLSTRTTVWTSEAVTTETVSDYQTLGRLYAYGDCLYAGVWARSSQTGSDGVFFCIDKATGRTRWTYRNAEHPAGYYWNRAAKSHGRLFFMSEDGSLISHSLTDETVYETRSLTDGLEVRNGLTASGDGDSLYTVTKAGILLRIRIGKDGSITDVERTHLIPDDGQGKLLSCTSTPAIYGGRLYVGCIYDGYGCLCVIDADTLQLIYRATGPKGGEIKSRPLILPVDDGNGDVNVYVTANESTGSLYLLTDHKNATTGTLKTLFTPYSARQYCLANVSAGEDGTLYYSNDSGTLFAIGETLFSADLPADIIKKKKQALSKLTDSLREVLTLLIRNQFR